MILIGAILAVAAIGLLLMGKRRQSRGVVALGVVALVFSVGIVTTHALGVNWDRLKPYAVLEYEISWAQRSNPARAEALMNEVKWRLSNFKLDPQRLWPLVEPALKAHGDPAADWSNLDMDLIETYDHWVGLSANQALAFRKSSIRTVVEVRPEVRVGDTLPILFRTSPRRTSTRFNAWKGYRILSCTLGGKEVVPRYGQGSVWKRRTEEDYAPESRFILVQMDVGGMGGAGGAGGVGGVGLGVGVHPLVLEIEHRIHDSKSDEPLSTWVETIETTVEVVPERVDGVEPFSQPTPCPLEGKVLVDSINIQRLSGAASAVWVSLWLIDVEVACSFDLVAKSETGEIALGRYHFIPSSDPTAVGNQTEYRIRVETNKRIIADKADLVFRSTPAAARSSVRLVGPWADAFVLRDVPIQWPRFFDLTDPESLKQLSAFWALQSGHDAERAEDERDAPSGAGGG